MTDHNDSPLSPLESILADLRGTEAAPADSDLNDVIDPLLALLMPLPADSAAAAAVDRVTSEPPLAASTARRMRLLETVDRGLAARRRDAGPLQAVLQRRRASSGMTLEQTSADIAARTGSEGPTPERLASIESGATSLRDDDSAVELTADWAVVIGVPREICVEALTMSLQMATPEPFLAAAGGAGPTDLSGEDVQILAAFGARYDATTAKKGK